MTDTETLFEFRVTGVDGFARSSSVRVFDETYKVEAEHPVEALTKLLSEVEWAILDTDEEFSIAFVPVDHPRYVGLCGKPNCDPDCGVCA